jgi:hypothetical protein
VKQESGASSSTSCIGASSAHLQHQRVEGGVGFVEIDKPDNGGTASSISSSSFNTQKELASHRFHRLRSMKLSILQSMGVRNKRKIKNEYMNIFLYSIRYKVADTSLVFC